MSSVLPTDKVLVQRAATLHSAPADMSTVQDTDLILVNRAGIDYHCTFADWKAGFNQPPSINTVVLTEDAAGAPRFTSQGFTTTVTMTNEGKPASTKGLKGWVQGALTASVNVGKVVSQAVGAVKASDYLKSYAVIGGPELGWRAPNNSADKGFSGAPDGVHYAWGNNDGSGGFLDYHCTWKPPSPVVIRPGGNLMYSAWQGGKAEAGGSMTDNFYVYNAGGARITAGFTASDVALPWGTSGNTVDAVKLINTSGAPITVSAFEFHRYDPTTRTVNPVVLTGLMINDKWLNDSVGLTTFTLDALADGKVNTGDTITGATSGATAVVSVVDSAAKTITVDPPTGTFQNGEAITVKATLANAKLFLKFNAAGAVSDLSSADPGFVAMTGAGPYKLTFPATLPSGAAPDTDLPAGTTITTEVQAVNSSATVTKASNTVTPA